MPSHKQPKLNRTALAAKEAAEKRRREAAHAAQAVAEKRRQEAVGAANLSHGSREDYLPDAALRLPPTPRIDTGEKMQATLFVHLRGSEKRALTAYCELIGLSVAQFMRMAALEKAGFAKSLL